MAGQLLQGLVLIEPPLHQGLLDLLLLKPHRNNPSHPYLLFFGISVFVHPLPDLFLELLLVISQLVGRLNV